MIIFRFTTCILFCFLLGQTFVSAKVSTVQSSPAPVEHTVPDRDIQYAENSSLPQWKVDWDQARALYRQNKVGQALVQYELLLQKKSTIDEARWEYTALLIQEKRWQQAGKQLDTLLARDPNNRKYLLARAQVLLEEGLAEQAVKQYGQLYEGSPSSDDALQALTGLIASLDKLGNRAAQLPLLEQLLLRKPGNLPLLKQIGKLALELGYPEKTKELLSKPLEDHPDDVDLLRLLAMAQDDLGHPEKAASCRKRLVALLPNDIQANKWLASYYQGKGDFSKALTHVERQLKADPGAVNLILQTARLYNKMDHPGQALDYFALYLDLVPDNQKVIEERNRTRKKLAADLVALVENKRARQLWKDLKQITGDREGVYLQMADWFRQQGKQVELTEVLLVLYRQHPESQQLYSELVSLLQSQGRYNELEKL